MLRQVVVGLLLLRGVEAGCWEVLRPVVVGLLLSGVEAGFCLVVVEECCKFLLGWIGHCC